jgi:hypothetical protein
LSKSLPTVDVPEATDVAEYEDEEYEGEGEEVEKGEQEEESEDDEPTTGNVPEPTTT